MPLRLLLQLRRTAYLSALAEVAGAAAIALELLIPASTFWAATPQLFPSAAAIPTQSTIQRHIQHPAHPRDQPTRAGVRSEPPRPAERTNKTPAGSHKTGSLDDFPHLLPAAGKLKRAPITQNFVARTPARVHAHAQPPQAHQSLNPPLPKPPTQILAARAPLALPRTRSSLLPSSRVLWSAFGCRRRC